MAVCRSVTVLVLIHNIGGLLAAEVKSAIVGGQNAPIGGWPWMVHLNITSYDHEKWRCGGAILSDEWVLTAANCWDTRRKAKVARSMAWVGTSDLQKASVRYMGILYVVSHPHYKAQGGGYVNDIALVRLKKKLRFSERVGPVGLPSGSDAFGSSSECWITGWGDIGTGVPLPDPEPLQQLRIPIIPRSECREAYPDLTADVLCAGDMAGGKDACKGDYGGPLVCRAARGFVQAGIMSYGSERGCGLPGQPGVYTQVSSYLRFINDYVHQGEEASAEV
ncbi:tryptase-2-like [Brachionichthys hirsutus]|uniref:tryptase-2-like n=1 Tax=Brachionichthys hirsutus TaxID=412623 RepID=UPI0036052C31